MSKDEFDVCKTDPYRAYDIAQAKIAELQQRVTVQKNINAALLQDPQYQYGQAVQQFEKLKKEHIQLNDQYNDMEAVNETLQEVIEVLRGDKHQLLVELNAIKREIMIQRIENSQLDMKHRQIRAYNESLDLTLKSQEAQLSNLDDEIKDGSKQQIALTNEISALESTAQNLSLQSSSLSDLRQHLETTRAAQDRAIQALTRGGRQSARNHSARCSIVGLQTRNERPRFGPTKESARMHGRAGPPAAIISTRIRDVGGPK